MIPRSGPSFQRQVSLSDRTVRSSGEVDGDPAHRPTDPPRADLSSSLKAPPTSYFVPPIRPPGAPGSTGRWMVPRKPENCAGGGVRPIGVRANFRGTSRPVPFSVQRKIRSDPTSYLLLTVDVGAPSVELFPSSELFPNEMMAPPAACRPTLLPLSVTFEILTVANEPE